MIFFLKEVAFSVEMDSFEFEKAVACHFPSSGNCVSIKSCLENYIELGMLWIWEEDSFLDLMRCL
jgi:hypothetical protein